MPYVLQDLGFIRVLHQVAVHLDQLGVKPTQLAFPAILLSTVLNVTSVINVLPAYRLTVCPHQLQSDAANLDQRGARFQV